MARRTKLGLLALSGLIVATPAMAGILLQGFEHEPHNPGPGSYWQHLAELTPELKTAGITAIWIPSPAKGASGGFSSGYDPYDLYDLGSKDQRSTIPTRFGTKEDLLAMIAVCHRLGVQIYSDCVVNHRGGGDNGGYDYRPRGSEGMGRLPMSRRDFNDPYAGGDWHKEVGGGRDLNQNEPYVRDGLQRWIRWFDNQTGVDGYRLDAAKHMNPYFIEGLLYQVQEGNYKNAGDRFVVSEFFDGNPYILGDYINQTKRRTSVFDFGQRYNTVRLAHAGGYGDIRSLLFHLKDYEKSVTFLNNHDTFGRGNGDDLYYRGNLAHAIMLAFPGYPTVFYPDLLDSRGYIRPYLRTLMWINTFLAHGRMIERWADGDLLIIERQGNLIAGFNDAGNTWRSAWVKTDFGANQHLHDFSGIAPDVYTNGDGYAYIAVPPNGYVNYGRAFTSGFPAPAPKRTIQEYEAEGDMDLRPAGEFWGETIRFAADFGQPIFLDVYFKDSSVEGSVALFDHNGKLLNTASGKGHVYTSYLNPPNQGWYQVRVALKETGQGKRSGYFLKTSYMGSPFFPRQRPAFGNTDANLPPLK